MAALRLPEHWSRAIEDVVIDLLSQAGVESPPVDALSIARRLGVTVIFDRSQSNRGRYKSLAGRPTVFVRPDDRPERVQWAVAHELGEIASCRVAEQFSDFDEVTPRCREEIANQIASRMLLPSAWFANAVESTDGDLFQLKTEYATASHELMALRTLDLEMPTVITVFDRGQITRRKSNVDFAPRSLQPTERQCAAAVHAEAVPVKISAAEMTVRGWPIHEPQWKREILRTTFVPSEYAVGSREFD